MTASFFVCYFIPVFLESIEKSCVQGWHCPCMNVGFLSHSAFLLWVYGEPAVKLGKGVMYLVILGFSLTMVWDWLSSLIGKFLIWFWFFFCFFFVFFSIGTGSKVNWTSYEAHVLSVSISSITGPLSFMQVSLHRAFLYENSRLNSYKSINRLCISLLND